MSFWGYFGKHNSYQKTWLRHFYPIMASPTKQHAENS